MFRRPSGEKELLELIEVDHHGLLRALFGKTNGPGELEGRAFGVRLPERKLLDHRVEKPRERLDVLRPSIDGDEPHVVLVGQRRQYGSLHERGLARARRAVDRKDPVREDAADEPRGEIHTTTEACAIAASVWLRPGEGVVAHGGLDGGMEAIAGASSSGPPRTTGTLPSIGRRSPASQISCSSGSALSGRTATLPVIGFPRKRQ